MVVDKEEDHLPHQDRDNHREDQGNLVVVSLHPWAQIHLWIDSLDKMMIAAYATTLLPWTSSKGQDYQP